MICPLRLPLVNTRKTSQRRKIPSQSRTRYPAVNMDILGIDSLFAELTLGLGLATGWRQRLGQWCKTPAVIARKGAQGQYRSGRAWFFVTIGLVMAAWAHSRWSKADRDATWFRRLSLATLRV